MIFLTGCSGDKTSTKSVENALSKQLSESGQIDSVIFVQGQGINSHRGGCDKEDSAEDIVALINVFMQVSSDGEAFDEYKSEGFHKLNTPSIIINYTSGESDTIEWEIGKGILVHNETEYYIDKQQAQKLYDVFTKYNPYVTGLQ